MGRKALVSMAVVTTVLALPSSIDAQVATWQDVQRADIETMGDKFAQLAEAFDESLYDWRPMEDVRSVREVLGLAIAEANLFPTAWGLEPGPGAAAGFGAELERAAALSKSDMLSELGTSFDYLVGVVGGMDRDKRMSDSSYFRAGHAYPREHRDGDGGHARAPRSADRLRTHEPHRAAVEQLGR